MDNIGYLLLQSEPQQLKSRIQRTIYVMDTANIPYRIETKKFNMQRNYNSCNDMWGPMHAKGDEFVHYKLHALGNFNLNKRTGHHH